ncbi:cell wall-binding repeat-containing protein [Herbiconiux solani]|uniref:cell wall-binding repeat-containing protein n=1 Tax=Herbiconiux solani TaxID=661329 RepID=UPI0008254180|nr:cell wall-binding repeat-containing protein [Herbiconiux solani]
MTRITGADRYDVAVHIAQATRTRADVVYLASGNDFPDALSAGPAVVHEQGVLLLVPPTGITFTIGVELASLAPKRVVIVGGPLSVPETIVTEVRSILGPTFPVARISGADRYDVSRRLAATVFSSGASTVFSATGTTFPDALSAGPAAVAWDAPLVLMNGALPAADSETLGLFSRLHTSWVALTGGPASLSPGIEASLAGVGTVTRFAGADRYEVSAVVNEQTLSDFETVYLATGTNFPDALAGGVLAGTQRHPLYIVPSTCVPGRVLDRLARFGTRSVVLLGGPLSLTPAVESLTRC